MLAVLDQAEPFVADDAESVVARDAVKRLKGLEHSAQGVKLVVSDGPKIYVPLPTSAVGLIIRVLEAMGNGTPVSVIPHDAELTTQQAADFLNVSRPFLVNLVDSGKISHRLVGRHRRIRFSDLLAYRESSKRAQRESIDALVQETKRLGLE